MTTRLGLLIFDTTPGAVPAESGRIGDISGDGLADYAIPGTGRVIPGGAALPRVYTEADFAYDRGDFPGVEGFPGTVAAEAPAEPGARLGETATTGDVDGDGREDRVTLEAGAARLTLTDGGSLTILAEGLTHAVGIGDLNGDGLGDLALDWARPGEIGHAVLFGGAGLAALDRATPGAGVARVEDAEGLIGMDADDRLSDAPVLFGGGGDDRLRLSPQGRFAEGGAGDDTLAAGAAYGATLDGGAGDDRILGGEGDDRIAGGAGQDRAHAGLGDDVLSGGSGDDRLMGGIGRDWLRGGAGDDALNGGLHADRIEGGSGTDRILGGHGADRFVFRAGSDEDRILDFDPMVADGLGREAPELLDFSAHGGVDGFADLRLVQIGAHTVVAAEGTRIVLANTMAEELTAENFVF